MHKVLIRPLKVSDAEISYKWRNDPEIWKYTGNKPSKIITKEIEEDWIKQKLIENNSYRFAITVNDVYVGNIQITDINNLTGQYYIFIGEKEYWGKGIAQNATFQILRFAKNVAKLRSVFLSVNPENRPAIKLYENCGFKKYSDKIEMNYDLTQDLAPKLSIFFMTYNHEKYIGQSLNSVLMQKTNFDFEIVVGEDCSTDNTRTEILKISQQYPGKFKLLLHEKNLGAMNNQMAILESCNGKYIAMLEGDDYWTDPLKLQKQVDFLEANEDFAICSSNAILKNEIDKTEFEWLGKKHKEISTLKDILRYGSGGATCTLVFRSQAIKELPDWYYSLAGGDWALQIICTSIGKMKYFREVFAVYRRNAGGITATNSIDNSILVYENYGIKTIDILIDNFSNYKNELQTHAVEHIYYNLAFLYYNKGNMDKTRLIIRKILQKILKIDISFKNIVHLIILYIKCLSVTYISKQNNIDN